VQQAVVNFILMIFALLLCPGIAVAVNLIAT
jgi:hypothetical protein